MGHPAVGSSNLSLSHAMKICHGLVIFFSFCLGAGYKEGCISQYILFYFLPFTCSYWLHFNNFCGTIFLNILMRLYTLFGFIAKRHSSDLGYVYVLTLEAETYSTDLKRIWRQESMLNRVILKRFQFCTCILTRIF